MKQLACVVFMVVAAACEADVPRPAPPQAPSVGQLRLLGPPPVPPGHLPCVPEPPPVFSRIATGGYICENGLCRASLAQVLSNMSDFDGVRVHTYGVLNIGYETNALYASREDFEDGGLNAVRIDMPCDPTLSQFAGLHARHVWVIGRFRVEPGASLVAGRLTIEKLGARQVAKRKALD